MAPLFDLFFAWSKTVGRTKFHHHPEKGNSQRIAPHLVILSLWAEQFSCPLARRGLRSTSTHEFQWLFLFENAVPKGPTSHRYVLNMSCYVHHPTLGGHNFRVSDSGSQSGAPKSHGRLMLIVVFGIQS